MKALALATVFLPFFGAIAVLKKPRWNVFFYWTTTVLSALLLAHSLQRTISISATWLSLPGVSAPFSLEVGRDSALLLVYVNLLALAVATYSLSYFKRPSPLYFLGLGGFHGAVSVFILSKSLLPALFSWDLFTLSSYFLVMYPLNERRARASTRLFFVNKAGDLAFYVGAGFLAAGGSLAGLKATGNVTLGTLLTATFLLLVASSVKTAQYPFTGWLIEAMEGSAPISALLHSSTLVASGVLLLWKFESLFLTPTPLREFFTLYFLFSSALSAVSALSSRDVKKVLAYSTASTLGVASALSLTVNVHLAILLLVAHGFVKAALFMAYGETEKLVGRSLSRLALAEKEPTFKLATSLLLLSLAGVLPSGLAFAKALGLWRCESYLRFLSPASPLLFHLLFLAVGLFVGLYAGRLLWASVREGSRPLLSLSPTGSTVVWFSLAASLLVPLLLLGGFWTRTFLPPSALLPPTRQLSAGDWVLLILEVLLPVFGVVLAARWAERGVGSRGWRFSRLFEEGLLVPAAAEKCCALVCGERRSLASLCAGLEGCINSVFAPKRLPNFGALDRALDSLWKVPVLLSVITGAVGAALEDLFLNSLYYLFLSGLEKCGKIYRSGINGRIANYLILTFLGFSVLLLLKSIIG